MPASFRTTRSAPALVAPAKAVFLDAKTEAELTELSDEEAAEFRVSGASALEEVVRRLRDALDLVTFFTAGEQDTRAWTLRRGETALDAAASIHTDIARGFIRAEVFGWQELVEAGSASEVAKRGQHRLEALRVGSRSHARVEEAIASGRPARRR